jgi:hypothetical protein|tara:strand:+ start:2407 stop:3288 length:882 start_codon:yes stop_codon:yes gene_type:complete
MAIYRTESSKVVIRKVFRDLRLQDSNWIDDAVEWIGEALEHIGSSTQLTTKTCVLPMKDHRHLLPSDLYYINQVAVNSSIATNVGGELDDLIEKVKSLNASIEDAKEQGMSYDNTVVSLQEINSRIVVLENSYFQNDANLAPLQYGASNFHDSIHCENCVNLNAKHEHTYIIDDGYIKTSFATGKICLSYKVFPTDGDSFPLVPADISFKEAMFWYIYKKLLLSYPKLVNNGVDYMFAEQQWKYYCTQARNAANYPDIDRYESFMNQWVNMIPSLDKHDLAFEQLNSKENFER